MVLRVTSDADLLVARKRGREIADNLGFSQMDQALIATVISELARNILRYAGSGELRIGPNPSGMRPGIFIVAADRGDGIASIEAALRDGFSTSGGLGLGLPGTRRLVDEFELESAPGEGTTVTARKFLSPEK